ncbi:MAG: GNAT family N-acetyltransferase [Acidimicrobiales bacterium]
MERPTGHLPGPRVRLSPPTDADRPDLDDLDWRRSLHPGMGGWLVRPIAGDVRTSLVRSVTDDEPIGVIDVAPLPGYAEVMSVSLYIDPTRARGGLAFEAYARVVTQLFESGTRLVHHEVLELNRPILRLFRGIGEPPSARLREHAYSAGRLWDVLVFAFDSPRWNHLLGRLVPRNPVRRAPSEDD